MNEFLQKLRLVQTVTPHMELDAAKRIVENQSTIFADLMQHNNEKIVWSNMVMPTEILYAAGLIPLQTELIAGWMSTLDLSKRFIHSAHAKKYNLNICSYHKTVIGCLEEGILVPPKIAVLSAHICDGGSMIARYLKERFGTCVILLHVPYHGTKLQKEKLLVHLDELKNCLEKYTGVKITGEKLKQALVYSNRSREFMVRANEIRKTKTTFLGNLAIRNMFGANFLYGSSLGADVLESYYNQLKSANKIEGENRILWIHFAPLHNNLLMEYFETVLGCVIVFDITGYVYWDTLNEDSGIEAVAYKMMSHYYLGDSAKRIQLYQKIIKEYSVDGMVIFMQQGCKAIPCSSWELKEVSVLTGTPLLELYGDCVNPEGISLEQVKLRMEAFKEGLVNRKNVYGN